MKLLNKNTVVISILVLCTVAFLFVYLNLNELLTYLSPRHEVKEHFVEKVRFEFIVFFVFFILLYCFFVFGLPFIKKYITSINYITKGNILKEVLIKNILLYVIGVYIFIAPIFVMYSLDISTDESTYAYTGQHYYEFNKFMIKFDNDNYQIPKDMFLQNIPLIILKPFVPYTVNLMRYITYFYSMFLAVILFIFFRKSLSKLGSEIYLILAASYSGFIFLSGTSYGENSALLFSFLSIYLFSKYYDTNKLLGLHLASLFMALAVITKIQLGIFVLPALVLYSLIYYLKNKEYKHMLLLLAETVLFSLILVSVLWLFSYSLKEIKTLVAFYYSVSINSVTYTEKSVSVLMNIERFFDYHMLIFFPLVFFYFYDKKYEKTFIEKYFFTVFLMNALWYITMKGYNFRFMYFAQFGIILLSVKPISLYYKQASEKIKNTIKLYFVILLVVGILQTIKMTANGVSNDYLFFLNGNNPLKTFFKYDHNTDQKEFYDKVKEIVGSDETVYYVGAEFEVMAFIPNKFYTFDITKYNPDLKIKYIIRTSINDQLDINLSANDFLKNKCEKVYEKGLYCLYKIK